MACSCCKEAVHIAEEEAAEVKEAMETVAVKVEEVAEDLAEEANRIEEGIAEGVKELAVEAKELVEEVVEDVEAAAGSGMHVVKDFFEAKMIDVVKVVLNQLPPVIKKVTDDPEAPKSAKETKDKAIDLLWPEVEKEAIRQLTADFYGLPDENLEGTPRCCLIAKLRYCLYPYNRGLAGVQQDKFWMFCVFLAAIPLWSAPAFFFLLVFAVIDKTDEFQLLFFILQVRGMQFVSDGFLQVYLRYFWNFICLMTGNTCHVDPVTGGTVPIIIDLTGYGIRVILVWISWVLLYSVAVQKRPKNLDKAADMAIKNFRSGKLHYFLIADMVVSLASIAALIVVAVTADTQTLEFVGVTVCVKVVHGVLCAPFFVLLVVPLLRNIVLHTFATGYDQQGRCRNYVGAQVKPGEVDSWFKGGMVKMEEVEALVDKVKTSVFGVTSMMKSA